MAASCACATVCVRLLYVDLRSFTALLINGNSLSRRVAWAAARLVLCCCSTTRATRSMSGAHVPRPMTGSSCLLKQEQQGQQPRLMV
ncbi:MAG: hypothetical protein J3K34DRAFT_401569 [Monoraphidium minutum]|nr:MAG: hypothetical protein J3K34DRAFT_401569 [Monoraphidium minutum]